MTHVILTGAAGFVGSHVLRHLLTETDWTIACPYTFGHRGTPQRVAQQTEDLAIADRTTFVCCDLAAEIDPVTRALLRVEEADLIFNVASESSVDRSLATPVPFVQNNVNLALSMIELARAAPNLKALLQVSTDEVYGPAPKGYNSREWDPIIPSNPYAASKGCQECLFIAAWRSFGLPLILTNTMNIFGEMQDPEKFIPSTIRKIVNGETVTIHAQSQGVDVIMGGPAPMWTIGSRCYLHARNQADALLFLAREALGRLAEGENWTMMPLDGSRIETLRYDGSDRPPRFNVVGEHELDNLEVAQLIRDEIIDLNATVYQEPLGWYELVDFHSSRPGHDLRYALDGSKLAGLGWVPPVPLRESLERTVQWTLDHREWLL